MGGLHGNYRINATEFPVPTTRWEEQPVAAGLDGRPINASYRLHTWNWSFLPGEKAEDLYALFQTQQSGTPLTALETDPYDASGSDAEYGTTTYTDFVMQALSPRVRGLPFYDDVTVSFEVYVA